MCDNVLMLVLPTHALPLYVMCICAQTAAAVSVDDCVTGCTCTLTLMNIDADHCCMNFVSIKFVFKFSFINRILDMYIFIRADSF